MRHVRARARFGFALVALLAATSTCGAQSRGGERPNILFAMADAKEAVGERRDAPPFAALTVKVDARTSTVRSSACAAEVGRNHQAALEAGH